jgi:malonyl-CoA O-methyltransferase
MLDQIAVQAQFCRVAKSYDASSVLQRHIAEELIDRLDFFGPVEDTLLDLGSATGYLGRCARRKFPRVSVVEVDMITAMAIESSKANPLVKAVISLPEKLALADESMPLVLSNLLLHWCDVGSVFSEVARVLQIGGSFFFSTLGPDTLLELRSAWDQVDSFPHVHDFVDMHDLGDALVMAGLSEPVLDIDRLHVTYQNVSNVIDELRSIGATNVRRDRRRTWTGKNRYIRFLSACEAFFDQGGRLPTTWEVIYGVATKDRAALGSTIPVVTGSERA